MKSISLIFIIIFPLSVYSQNRPGVITDGDGNVIGRGVSTPVSLPSSTTNGISDENLKNSQGFQNATSGAESNARESESSSDATKMLGMLMGAMFMTQCGPKNPMACVMAAMSFMDAAASGENQGNSDAFGNSLLPGGEQVNTANAEEQERAREAKAQLKALEGMGYIANADGSITTPEGESFSGKDFGSSEGLQRKGLTPGQANSAMDLLKGTQDEAMKEVAKNKNKNKKNRGLASVSGAAAGASDGASVLPDLVVEEGGSPDVADKKHGVGRLPAAEASKLSKNFNGTPIGIGMADLFLIVKQKYEEKNEQKEFINKEY